MDKTTMYLPAELKKALTRLARARQCSEATIVREALAQLTEEAGTPAPRIPLFHSRGPSIAGDVDRALDGFGSS